MKTNAFYISLITLLLISFSCKKNQMGGKSTVQGTVFHHAKRIPNAKIYIKFNSTDFPGNDASLYDIVEEADANGDFKLNFYKGNYYLYGVGKDYGIAAPYDVVGGVSILLRTNEDKQLNIYVTEGD